MPDDAGAKRGRGYEFNDDRLIRCCYNRRAYIRQAARRKETTSTASAVRCLVTESRLSMKKSDGWMRIRDTGRRESMKIPGMSVSYDDVSFAGVFFVCKSTTITYFRIENFKSRNRYNARGARKEHGQFLSARAILVRASNRVSRNGRANGKISSSVSV